MKTMMYAEQQRMIEDDVVPFGFHEDGVVEEDTGVREGGDVWFTQKEVIF